MRRQVRSVYEKAHRQAPERAQGWLRLPDGKALTGFHHEYERHGTSTLFAALEVATGQVKAGHFQRRRHRDFLAFMNEIVAAYPRRELHVIVDNLNIHKPKRDCWLRRHPRVHLHVTPTHASWHNQVEIWFNIITQKAIRRGTFGSVKELVAKIECFVRTYNAQASPFVWTATADSILKKIERLCEHVSGAQYYLGVLPIARPHGQSQKDVGPRLRPCRTV